jgi:uncharacterized protein YndB with AHSA1/START domain
MNESVQELPPDQSALVIEADFARLSADGVFKHLTDLRLLTHWWPQEAESEGRQGGSYHLGWPGMNWHLRGTYVVFDPPHKLGYTWHWDHEPDMPVQEVFINIRALKGGGSSLHLTQGPHDDTEQGREQRRGHVEGWQHFLGRLQELKAD